MANKKITEDRVYAVNMMLLGWQHKKLLQLSKDTDLSKTEHVRRALKLYFERLDKGDDMSKYACI